MKTESGKVMPARISKEALDAAIAINRQVGEILADYGLVREGGIHKSTEALAKMVQLAINRSIEKMIN